MKTENKKKQQVPSSVVFHAEQSRRGKLSKNIVIVFFVILLATAAVSAFVLLKENDFKISNIRRSINPNAEITTEAPTEPSVLSGKVNLLLACNEDGTNELYYAAVLDIDLNRLSMNVCIIPTDTMVTADGYTGNLHEQFAHGGMPQLALAVEDVTGIGIERYIRAGLSDFKKAIKLFDSIEYFVPETSVCEMNGVSFTIESGRQELTPDLLIRYMTYLSQTKDAYKLSDLLCAVLNETATAETLRDADYYFNSLSNLFDTDISAMDFAKYREKITAFLTDENRVPASPAENTDSF